MAQIAIVGNGPARELYDDFDGTIIACNIPQIKKYDYIAMVDRKALDYVIHNKLTFKKPILIPTELKGRAQEYQDTKIITTFQNKLMNCAATAAFHFAQEYDTIWLYGCNALWSEETKSSQDEFIPRPYRANNLHLQWRERWKQVWQTGKHFVIVHPHGVTPHDYGENVQWYSVTRANP